VLFSIIFGTLSSPIGLIRGRSSPSRWEGASLLFRVRGETQRADSGAGVLERGQPARESGGVLYISCRSAVGTEPRLLKGFLALWRRQIASSGTCWGQVQGGGMAHLPPPFKSAHRPHRMRSIDAAYSRPRTKWRGLSVCWSRPRAVQKRMNRSRRHIEREEEVRLVAVK